MFDNKKLPKGFYWFLAVIGAVAFAILFFTQWGLEWYQENEMEWEYGIFSIVFLIIHLIPFLISVVGGGLVGVFVGSLLALAIDSIIAKLCESETNASGTKKMLTKPRKILLIIAIILIAIPVVILTSRAIEKRNIKSDIANYLSSEFGLEDVEVKFTEPYSDFYKYGVEIHSSNLDSLEYDKMTRIVYYLTSRTGLKSDDVEVTRFVCGDDSYKIYANSVFMNGHCVYEYQKKPSHSITSADAPYYGMDAEFIGNTKLGSPDETELCRDYYALKPERRSITYKWYDTNGRLVFSAYALNGKVISVTDFRK